MSKFDNYQIATLSLMDKLKSQTELYNGSRSFQISSFKESVRLDLEAMLNTRRRCASVVSQNKYGSGSLIGYGVPDFTGAGFITGQDREALKNTIETTLKENEPRFKKITVTEIVDDHEGDRSIRYKIHAELHITPSTKPIVFDSLIDPVTRKVNIKESTDGR